MSGSNLDGMMKEYAKDFTKEQSMTIFHFVIFV